MIKEPNLKDFQDLQLNFDMISKGIRPEGMDFEKFKYYRKICKSLLDRRLKGEIVHISSVYGQPEGTGVTYVKSKELV